MLQRGSDAEVIFAGCLEAGLPEGMCSVRWRDGSEYHGEFGMCRGGAYEDILGT